MDFSYTLYIVLIPLFTFLITGLLGHKIKDSISGLIGTFGLGASAVISYLTAYNYFFKLGKVLWVMFEAKTFLGTLTFESPSLLDVKLQPR